MQPVSTQAASHHTGRQSLFLARPPFRCTDPHLTHLHTPHHLQLSAHATVVQPTTSAYAVMKEELARRESIRSKRRVLSWWVWGGGL